MLVWENPTRSKGELPLEQTRVGTQQRDSAGDEPQVFELIKSNNPNNAFVMGITLGRTSNNDLVIEDSSVSRFHAYFLHDPKSKKWKLVDAQSANGTWIGDIRLPPDQPVLVPDESRIRFGDIEMLFLTPESFMKYLDRLNE